MKIILFFISLCTVAFAMPKIRVYEMSGSERLLHQTSEYSEIADILRTIGVRFEKWETNQILPADANQEQVIAAYKEDVERLCGENGYKTVDVVRMFPQAPKKVELRQKFLNEHTHSEDEVRLFVEGSGLFYMHVQDKVYIVLCEKGDLISIPAYYAHWFDMGQEPYFTAIRFFIETSGWVANFTGSDIAQRFPKYGE